jgi:subtilisin family serine protease
VAGILSSKRGSRAPAICPECTLLVRPIFPELTRGGERWPGTSAQELAEAIVEAVKAGARVLNLSVDLLAPSSSGERRLCEALNYAASTGAIAVVAAGNQSLIGSSALTRHPWVIPVIACRESGEPLTISNLGASMGANGLRAPGENVTSIGTDGAAGTFSGTSAAAPFVSGTAALLWSLFPKASATAIKMALTRFQTRRPLTLVPPLLDAWAAYRNLAGALMRA